MAKILRKKLWKKTNPLTDLTIEMIFFFFSLYLHSSFNYEYAF